MFLSTVSRALLTKLPRLLPESDTIQKGQSLRNIQIPGEVTKHHFTFTSRCTVYIYTCKQSIACVYIYIYMWLFPFISLSICTSWDFPTSYPPSHDPWRTNPWWLRWWAYPGCFQWRSVVEALRLERVSPRLRLCHYPNRRQVDLRNTCYLDGQPLMVRVSPIYWNSPPFRRCVEGIAHHFNLVWFGVSDWKAKRQKKSHDLTPKFNNQEPLMRTSKSSSSLEFFGSETSYEKKTSGQQSFSWCPN